MSVGHLTWYRYDTVCIIHDDTGWQCQKCMIHVWYQIWHNMKTDWFSFQLAGYVVYSHWSATIQGVNYKLPIVNAKVLIIKVLSVLICSNELILVSNEVHLRADSNDLSLMCISYNTKILFKFLLVWSQR